MRPRIVKNYKVTTLDNGLTLIVMPDHSVPVCVFNLMYKVGSRDEKPSSTGLAHLFEHLMFTGSTNVPDFDTVVTQAGGSSNAFTSTDVTNYYITLPSGNIETAFWVEADRMENLTISSEKLEQERKVVLEEYAQRYLNQPYGDVWHKFRALAYKQHPYAWPTIGKSIEHIKAFDLNSVKAFYKRFYNPENACLVIAGDISFDKALQLTQKWFGTIKNKVPHERKRYFESEVKKEVFDECSADVPEDLIVKGFAIKGLYSRSKLIVDLWAATVASGTSSLFYRTLVQETNLFTSYSLFSLNQFDRDLVVFAGRVNKEGKGTAEAHKALNELLYDKKAISKEELESTKQRIATEEAFALEELSARALNAAYCFMTKDLDAIHVGIARIFRIDMNKIAWASRRYIRPERSITLLYKSK